MENQTVKEIENEMQMYRLYKVPGCAGTKNELRTIKRIY